MSLESFQTYSIATLTATDSWTHGQNLTGWYNVYEQLKRGPYEGVFTVAWLGPFQLIQERVSGPGIYRGCAWEGSRIFACFERVNGYLNNHELAENSLVSWRWDGIDQVTMRDTSFGTVVAVDERWLVNQLSKCNGTPFHFDNVRPKFRYRDRKVAQEFAGELQELLRQLAADPTILDSPQSRVAAQKTVEDLLLRTQSCELSIRQPLPRPGTRAYIVDRVMQYIESAIHDSISMLDLCGVVRVSPRTLCYSFKSVLGVSPNRYLLATRLNRVHRDLRDSPPQVPIRQIAARWGFWHMGRFAKYYRDTFGERPSDTARNERRTRRSGLLSEGHLLRAASGRLSVTN